MVKSLFGKTIFLWVHYVDHVFNLQQKMKHAQGILMDRQHLIYGGKQLEDQSMLYVYNISKISTLNLLLRVCGGVVELGVPSTSKPVSSWDAIKNNSSILNASKSSTLPSAYIMEHVDEV
jgi:hypothetical protein